MPSSPSRAQARRLALNLFVVLAGFSVAARADVLISEIMYHPSSELTTEEYIELYNPGGSAVDLSGWKFTSGVAFTFPAATSIPAGGYLVVTANPAAFHAKYPAVVNYIASSGWSGQLSNSSNHLRLDDALGAKRDEVTYADDGDWAIRTKDTVADYAHKGWGWSSDADGLGKSLELINLTLDNDIGQNWAPSVAVNGTPGAPNGVAAADTAPFILDVTQFPFVPTSIDQVNVTARLVAATLSGVAVTIHYRNDGAASFTTATMFDDGAHGDALAGDGIYGALLPAQANNTIVEFYVRAVDAGSRSRTWPAPAFDDNLASGKIDQFCNCLYQVDNTVFAGAMPYYKMVMRAVDRAELTTINTTTAQAYSHARMNTTWITGDGTSNELRYLCGARNRGHGSADSQPQSFNIAFSNDRTWKGVTSLNLNTQYTHAQLFGSALFRKAGMTCPDSRQVQLRVNNVDPTGGSSGSPSFGFYVANEFQDSDFAGHHFPLDSSGNIYRGQRLDSNAQQADFSYIDNNPASYMPVWFKHTNTSENDWSDLIPLCQTLSKGHSTSSATTLSSTTTNGSTTVTLASTAGLSVGSFVSGTGIANGTMIFEIPSGTTLTLTNAATGSGTNNLTYRLFSSTYDAGYESEVQARTDVREWMHFFAIEALVDNSETNIYDGYGDDFYIYFGVTDPRCKLIPYDLDTICGQGDSVPTPTQHGLFRMTVNDDSAANGPTMMTSFMQHPSFAPIYYDELNKAINGAFKTTTFDALVDEILGGVAPFGQIASIKAFQNARTAHLASLIPLNISVTTAPAVLNGYPHTTASTTALVGKANAITTRSVKVNGVAATWNAWQATWTAASVSLRAGINRVLIQSFDGNSVETEHTFFDVWYDDASVASVSGAIAANTTWTAAGGPYQVTAALTVNSGVTLTIQPGTTVYLASGIGITVAAGGRLLAEGTETQPIRFSRLPGGTGNGGTITINGQAGVAETHFYYCYFEFGGNPALLGGANSDIVLDHCEWGRTDASYVHLDGGSFLISNCIFPQATAGFEGVHGTVGIPAGGRGIIRDSFFGKMQGYNDVIDYTGGNRPSPIVQFINNVFVGSDDDGLDLDGTDAWVEGNIFMHIRRNGAPDSSSAVSGGEDQGNSSFKSNITIVGNLFYDVDQAATAKEGNFYTFLQNTVVDQNGRGSQDATTGVLNFADTGIPEAAGMYVEGNIIHSAEALVRNYPGTALAGTVTFNNNLLPPGMTWSGLGSGNTNADPRLADVQLVDPNAPSGGAYNIPTPGPHDFQRVVAEIRAQFALGAGSPAKGTGPNGSDQGGVRAFGVTLGGAPVGTTNATTASITVGTRMTGNSIPTGAGTFPNGSGWTHYKWRLNGGAWSAEIANTAPIALSGLTNGVKTLEVVGKNDAGFYQDDAAFGTDARISSVSWTVDTNYVPPGPAPLVRISEVLAKNSDTIGFSGNFPDIIELQNAGNATADISGWGLTDNSALPYKYTIANGTMLAAGARLVIYASGAGSVPQPKTGFGLKDQGDTLTLTKSVAAGGGIADIIGFGAQLADTSIGRRESDGAWDMCHPTFGAPNVVAAQGTPESVKINEWLADAVALFPNDFIELMNTATLPVNVGNCYISDNPVEWPQHHQLRQLTFIAPGGYLYLKADDDQNQGPDHLKFKLASEQGELGFFDTDLNLVDGIVYGPQTSDISEGRTPNGENTIAFFNQPTPGGPNPGVTGVTVITTNVIPVNASWKYMSSATDYSATFYATNFNDTAWPSGGQLLYIENAALTNTEGFVKTTAVPVDTGNSNRPFNATYFRRHFTYNGPLTGVTLRATAMIDDGAVFYLNGVEIPNSRLRMSGGAVTFSTIANTNVGDAVVEHFALDASLLHAGDNVIAVAVHQEHAPGTQSSSDVTFGLKLDAETTQSAGAGVLVLNEVLPIKTGGAGWVELFNPGATPIDVSDMSLSDDPGTPRKFVFANGSSVPAGGYLTVNCDPLLAQSSTNTGFALPALGGGVYLFEKMVAGGGLHDAVSYGLQIPDFSLGRSPNGSGAFVLCVPTHAALNTPAALGSIAGVKLNEWFANPTVPPGFFELYNTGAQPVALGGNYLTDQLTDKTKSLIPPLSFIGGSGSARWRALIADNDGGATPGHVNFSLNPAGESIGLFSGAGVQLDAVTFGSQTAGVSQGRFPDGTSAILALTPTPGAANAQALADTDGDGIPDAWETANGLNPNDPNDALLDADGDGQSNKAEYLAGTNPQQPGSRLGASLVMTATPGQFAVRFTAIVGKTYSVFYKNALTDATWLKLADVAAQPADTLIDVTDPGSTGQPRRFYQVVTPQQP